MKAFTKNIFAAAALAWTLAVSGCSVADDGPHRQQPSGPEDNRFELRQNPDWSITYTGREEYVDGNGDRSEVDGIRVTSMDNEHYYLDIITKVQFDNRYGNDLKSYLEDELDIVAGNVKDYGSSFDAETSVGDQTFLFDRMRSGKWRAIALGITSRGELTGDYAVLDFTVSEEKPSEDYLKWTGNWRLTGKSKSDGKTDVTYSVSISQADANYIYTIRGWETGENMRNNMSDYSIEAIYDKFRGTMVFKGQYLETYTENNATYDFCFFGNFLYDGSAGYSDMTPGEYTITDYIPVAEAFAVSSHSASLQACGLDFDHDGSVYRTRFTSMQYFDLPYGDDGIFTYNDDIPEFPMDMTRDEDGTSVSTASAAPAAKALKITSARVSGDRHRASRFRKVL